jgi:hypothetical protein
MNLLLILFARCNASCDHCSESYGPHRREAMSKADIFRLMTEAAAIDDGTPLEFDITGGEPFVHFQLLLDVVTYGAELGAKVSCVTNGYWAKSPEVTTDKLLQLKQAGLDSLAVSVSRFHQRFVDLECAGRALEVAARLGIKTELKGAVTLTDIAPGGVLDQWKRTLDADMINIFPVLPQLRESAELPESEYYREPGLPEQKCPGAALRIDFNGVATSCCAPGSNESFLEVGNARSMSLADLYLRFRHNKRQSILREVGPIQFARAAIEAGFGERLRPSYAGPCDLCLHLRTDPDLRRIAENVSSDD